jgi:hypothetical protein
MNRTKNKVDYKQHNEGKTTVPEEADNEVKDSRNDMREKPKDHKQDHQAGNDPYP